MKPALILRQHRGSAPLSEMVHAVEPGAGSWNINLDSGSCTATYSLEQAGDDWKLSVQWRVTSGCLKETGLGCLLLESDWDRDAYSWMPAAVYAGNRFAVTRQSYPPKYPEDLAGPDAPLLIADVPHLPEFGTDGRIQLKGGDLSAPAMGFYHPGKGLVTYISRGHEAVDDLWEIEETGNGSMARFIYLQGGARERRYNFDEMRSDVPSVDKALSLEEGREISQSFNLQVRASDSVESLFRLHFERMWGGEGLVTSQPMRHEIPVAAASLLVEEKYARENWNPELKLHATTCDPASKNYFQAGWCGGGIADFALLAGQLGESREHASTGLNKLCRDGQLPNGLFYGKRMRSGKWIHDCALNHERPYSKNWHLVRRAGDLLYYLLKASVSGSPAIKGVDRERWRAAALRLADSLCGIWDRFGQLGFFLDAEAAEIAVGGSAGGGLVPAGLVRAYTATGEQRYLDMACSMGEHFYSKFTVVGLSTGGPGDACQAPDSESCAALLESYIALYEATGDRKWLDRSESQAWQLASWVMPYDYPFPPGTEFHRLGMPTTGSVFANIQNKHSAPGLCTHSGEALLKLYRATGDLRYAYLLARIVRFLPWTVSRNDRPICEPEYGAMPSGWINERVNTSDWDNNLGGIFYGSCWCEVSLLLTAAEIPSILVDSDRNKFVIFDHLEAEWTPEDRKLLVTNPTRFATRVTVSHEKSGSIVLKEFTLGGGEHVNLRLE